LDPGALALQPAGAKYGTGGPEFLQAAVAASPTPNLDRHTVPSKWFQRTSPKPSHALILCTKCCVSIGRTLIFSSMQRKWLGPFKCDSPRSPRSQMTHVIAPASTTLACSAPCRHAQARPIKAFQQFLAIIFGHASAQPVLLTATQAGVFTFTDCPTCTSWMVF
jgi:hypothetical protein